VGPALFRVTADGELGRLGSMLDHQEIRRRLGASATAAVEGNTDALRSTASWLTSATARELLRIDDCAREFRYEGPVLGEARQWTREVLASPLPVVAALAGMHRDGYVRQRAVESLAAFHDAVSDRALAVRVGDHVGAVREAAAREVLRRATLEHAEHIVPLLRRFEGRYRGAEVLPRYLRALTAEHGEAAVWAGLRSSADRDLRRAAFRHSFTVGLLALPEAVVLVPKERDQVVRRLLIEVIAGAATPEVVTRVLLRGRSAEGRALGLVKLTAAQLDPVDVERLLVDGSVLVRLWARRRWQEKGRHSAETYAAVARSTAAPIVRARAYTGLVETATPVGHQEIVDLAGSAELPLRKVGLSLLRSSAVAEDIPLLLRSVAGEDARVARLASEVLVGSPELRPLVDLAPFKTAGDPELRRRAWWIQHQYGGWHAVIADLEILQDADPLVAALGRQRVLPMYVQPTRAQAQRLTELLSTTRLDRPYVRSVAFAAGLPAPERPAAAQDGEPVPAASRRQWWRWGSRG
jgi:hypothetical protein